jgi:RNA polymerase sigma-70 factor, ECF subfamily
MEDFAPLGARVAVYSGSNGRRWGNVTSAATAPAKQASFEELVREHERMVFSIAYRFLRNGAAAEEVAQDVFLALFRSLSKLESPEHVVAWLRRVACHRSIDYARRNRNAAAEVSWDELAGGPRESGRAERESDPMLSKRLRQVVATLPDKMRMVVVLRYQEDAGLEEIAQAMRIPVNTVKSTLHRAHAILREKIGSSLGEGNV